MATLTIKDIWEIGIGSPHTKTDWQVSKTLDFNEGNLVFNVEGDTKNLLQIKGILRNPDGTIYDPYFGSYARARVWYGNNPSAWFLISHTPCTMSGIVVDTINKKDLLHKQYLSKERTIDYRTTNRYDNDDTPRLP